MSVFFAVTGTNFSAELIAIWMCSAAIFSCLEGLLKAVIREWMNLIACSVGMYMEGEMHDVAGP